MNPRLNRERWLKRLALQVASQLPDDPAEARHVLRHALAVVNFLSTDEPDPNKPKLRTV